MKNVHNDILMSKFCFKLSDNDDDDDVMKRIVYCEGNGTLR